MASASTALRNSQADGLVYNLNVLKVLDSSSNTLVAYTVNFSSPTSGQVTITGLPKTDTAQATGTATTARLVGSTQEEITGLAVGTAPGDAVTIDNTSISSGQEVELQSFSYTAPSSIA